MFMETIGMQEPVEARGGIGSLELELQAVGCKELNSGPLQEQ